MCCLLSPNLPPLKGGRVWCPTSPTTPTPRRDIAFKRKKRGVRSESAPVIVAAHGESQKRQPRAIVRGLLFAVASPPPGKESFRRRVWSALMRLPKEFCERRFRIHRPSLRCRLRAGARTPRKLRRSSKTTRKCWQCTGRRWLRSRGGPLG